ncbi:37017_t:CDS:2, partial [Gigaspora margarita]
LLRNDKNKKIYNEIKDKGQGHGNSCEQGNLANSAISIAASGNFPQRDIQYLWTSTASQSSK